MMGKKLRPQFLAYRMLVWPLVLIFLAACGDSGTATPVSTTAAAAMVSSTATPTIALTGSPVPTTAPATSLAATTSAPVTTLATTAANSDKASTTTAANPGATQAATTTAPGKTIVATIVASNTTPAAATSNPTIAPTSQAGPVAEDISGFITYPNPQANLPTAVDTALLQSYIAGIFQVPWTNKVTKYFVTTDADTAILKYYKDLAGQKNWDTYRNIERVGNYGVFGKATKKMFLGVESAARTNSSIKTALPAGSILVYVIIGDDLFPAPTSTLQDVPAYPGAQIPTLSAQDRTKNNLRDDAKVFLTTDSVSKVIEYYRMQMLSKGYLVMAIESCSAAPQPNATVAPEVADCSIAFSYFPGKEIQMKIGRNAISGLPAGTNAVVYGLENNDY